MKVGDYVRTKKGYIRQIKEIYDHILYYVNLDKSITMERYGEFEPITQLDRDTIDEIIKSSPNIIDLIQEGDYVNGERVDYIDDCKGAMREFYYTFEDVTHDVGHYEEEIETIVTKEQFKSMEYKLGVDKE